ncbi:hypothetical protein M0802_011581 [Mischocyttarus mexicanus]|nr:hypothetical protein M0802_011581 [Mischocyttarus mexicanus]
MFFIVQNIGPCTINKSITRNLLTRQGWQILTVLVILLTIIFPSTKASHLSRFTADALGDTAKLWDVSKTLKNVEHKKDLPASPAELLKPDKFLFYTYNDQGNMITKQMSLREIQALIAGGNGGHVAMEMYEPQKSGDLLNGEKNVMDVVEKVQNVLKSALDKPATMAGSLSSIPEYANAEWSSILPGILTNSEIEPDPTSEEPNYSEITKPDMMIMNNIAKNISSSSVSFNQESQSSTLKPLIITNTNELLDESVNDTISTTTTTTTASSFLLTTIINETKTLDKYTEKPMIPVPVITTEEQEPFTNQLEKIEDSMYQTPPTTKSSVEFIDIDHLPVNEMNNATMFEKVPVNVTKELEQNVTSYEESSINRVTEYVPILTMLMGSTVNESLVLPTNELSSSTENDITKKVTEIMSVETSTVETSINKINLTESITTMLSETITPTIKTHIETTEDLSNDNITEQSLDEISKSTTPQVLSTITSTSTLSPTKSAIDEEQFKTSQSFNLTMNETQTIGYLSTSTPFDNYFPVSLSFNSSDDASEGTSIGTTTDSENFSETSANTIATIITDNIILNRETSIKPIDYSTSKIDTNKYDGDVESLMNNLELLETNKTEEFPVSEEQSTLNVKEISKINDLSSTVQSTVTNDSINSTSTSTYTTETNFIRINDTLIDHSIISSIISEISTPTETTIINDLTNNISTESNDYVSNKTIESLLENITNDTKLITNTTVIPVLSMNETNFVNEQIENLIKDLSSSSTNQYMITTPTIVSNEYVMVTNSIKNNDRNTTVGEIKNNTMNSQMETLYTTTPINNIITDNVQTTESYSNNEETSFNPNKETSFVRHQNDVNESINSITTLEPLEQDTVTENLVTSTTTMLPSNTERIIIQDYVSTLIHGEQLPVTETILKIHNNTLINRTSIELESSLKTNESRYSDSKEDTSSTLKPSTSPYIKLNITFNDTTNLSSADNIITTRITENTTELFIESTPNSILKEPFDLFNQTNKTTIEESMNQNTTISESNMDQVIVNNTINIKTNQTDDESSLEKIEDKTEVKVASNDTISIKSDVVDETSSTKLTTLFGSTVTENSLGLKLTSKMNYNEKINESYSDDRETTTEKWMLIPHKVVALSSTEKTNVYQTNHQKIVPQDFTFMDSRLPTVTSEIKPNERIPLDSPASVNALDVTVTKTENDVVNFSKMCNNLAFDFWMAANKGLSTNRSLVLSPFGMVSLLAMIFLGARGTTSDQMNELLKLDDVATFNPHLVFQNVTDMVGLTRGQGITNTAFVRELFVDRAKVRKTLPFYKEQAQQFYEGLVAEVNFATIGDIVRRRTNLLVRKQTGGRIKDFIKVNTVPLRSPLAAVSANVFQTNCNSSYVSSDGRDGELYFAVSPAIRQRKLIPVPAIVWRSNILAGYEPSLDATAVALGKVENLVTTMFLLPGQQGHIAPGDTLDRLERRLIASTSRDSNWDRLLKVLLPRNSLELQIPKFTHRSVVNATAALRRMGFDRLFTEQADLKGINGIGNHLHLSDILQMNLFGTCGDENPTNGRHHMETYPATPIKRSRKRGEISVNSNRMISEKANREPNLLDFLETNASTFEETIPMTGKIDKRRKRYADNAKVTMRSERQRLKLDRPFLYFVRHNPTGLILHMGRFNPRLLP